MRVPEIVKPRLVVIGISRDLDLIDPLRKELERQSPIFARRLAEAYSEVYVEIEAGTLTDGPWIRWLADDLRALLDLAAPEGFYFGSPYPEGSIPTLGYFPREVSDV